MRLDNFISKALQISRKDAQRIIKSGTIRSSATLKDPSIKIETSDKIFYLDNQLFYSDKKRYILLHKPTGFVCSHTAEANHKSALDLIDIQNKRDLHFAGRLDARIGVISNYLWLIGFVRYGNLSVYEQQ